jgi:hypothetical protein
MIGGASVLELVLELIVEPDLDDQRCQRPRAGPRAGSGA